MTCNWLNILASMTAFHSAVIPKPAGPKWNACGRVRPACVLSAYLMMVSVVMSKATLVPGFSCDLSNWNTIIAGEMCRIPGNEQQGF